jgi:hypothetical protein
MDEILHPAARWFATVTVRKPFSVRGSISALRFIDKITRYRW